MINAPQTIFLSCKILSGKFFVKLFDVMNLVYEWVRPPRYLRAALQVSFPVIFSLLLHRFYHIVDNRYASKLGADALLLLNIQFIFISIGQFIGNATTTSFLIFWNHPTNQNSQLSLFKKHMYLALGLIGLVSCGIFYGIDWLTKWYQVPQQLQSFARIYIIVGLINMALQVAASSVDGLLIASRNQNYSLFFAGLIVVGKFLFDTIAVSEIFGTDIQIPLLLISLSTTLCLILFVLMGCKIGLKSANKKESVSISSILSVWSSEVSVSLIRAITPTVFSIQIARISASEGFLTSYNLALHLAFVACLPLIGSTQIAVRESSSKTNEHKLRIGFPPLWWNSLVYAGVIPTMTMLVIFAFSSSYFMKKVYEYKLPQDHHLFISAFFVACMIGQLGHILAVPLRTLKKSHLITTNYFISEFVILLGGSALLLSLRLFDPIHLAILYCVYAATYPVLNLVFLLKIKRGIVT